METIDDYLPSHRNNSFYYRNLEILNRYLIPKAHISAFWIAITPINDTTT